MRNRQELWFRVDDQQGRFHHSRPVFAVVVQNFQVVGAAPIARRRLLGQAWAPVKTALLRAGALVGEVR